MKDLNRQELTILDRLKDLLGERSVEYAARQNKSLEEFVGRLYDQIDERANRVSL